MDKVGQSKEKGQKIREKGIGTWSLFIQSSLSFILSLHRISLIAGSMLIDEFHLLFRFHEKLCLFVLQIIYQFGIK